MSESYMQVITHYKSNNMGYKLSKLSREFQANIHTMTKEQKQLWGNINNRLVSEVNEREYKTKSGYRNAMSKVYDNTITEYYKALATHKDN